MPCCSVNVVEKNCGVQSFGRRGNSALSLAWLKMNTQLLKSIINFAKNDENIRAIILEGSIAAQFQTDALSDYDLNLFCINYDSYLSNADWLDQFGKVLLYQKEQFQFYTDIIPTRLVLFHGLLRIDFSFWHINLLTDIVQGRKQYESYNNGYKIIIDKDKLAKQLAPSNGEGYIIPKPNRSTFLQFIYDFWFETYCIAKYLYRNDLWYAKKMENSILKEKLFLMILWNYQAKNNWKQNTLIHKDGKRFEKWIPSEYHDLVTSCFSRYDKDDTWRSLLLTFESFNKIAKETAVFIHVEYPLQKEKEINEYINSIKRINKTC
ncbi:MAG: aminoglycoside 6-adenylyltransferase [Actinobacteria bacterium]|nr:aminoglycoside 6-adenylyltransferase [Actinomycetota bacterium]